MPLERPSKKTAKNSTGHELKKWLSGDFQIKIHNRGTRNLTSKTITMLCGPTWKEFAMAGMWHSNLPTKSEQLNTPTSTGTNNSWENDALLSRTYIRNLKSRFQFWVGFRPQLGPGPSPTAPA